MISSIVLTGKHNIGINQNGKIKVDDKLFDVNSDIPFVRYRFESYGNEEYEYIKSMMQKFKVSTHLVEIQLSENSKDTVEYLINNIGNIAKYVYITVTDNEVNNGLSEETLKILETLKGSQVDRYMLKDKSTMLDTVAAKHIIKKCCTILGVKDNTFGVCSSPLSFGDWSCLTAVKARELMSIYSTTADVALPSANHQCMNCCGCIRHMIIDSDLEAPLDTKQKGTKKSEDKSENKKASKSKSNKTSIVFGQYNL